jgi:hypothetical protein
MELGQHRVGLAWSPVTPNILSFVQYKLGRYDIQEQKILDEVPCDG